MLKKYFIAIILCSFFDFRNWASAQVLNETVVNEVLFFAANESATARDRQIYQSVLREVFQKTTIGRFIKKQSDDFLLSRLSYKEAIAFGLQNTEIKVPETAKKQLTEYSKAEIDREVEIISKALALIEIKEAQFKEKDRFDTWFEVIKRKYQVKFKSAEAR